MTHRAAPRFSLLLLVCAFLIEASARGEAVRLAWDPIQEGGVISYHVYRSFSSGGPYTRLTPIPIQTTYYTDDSRKVGQTCYYSVTTVNSDGIESGFAREVQIALGRFDPVPQISAVVVRTSADITADAGQMVILSGAAHNPESKNLSYLWTQIPTTTVPITGRTNSEASFMAPHVSQDTLLTFVLIVTDSDGYTVADTVRVTVHPK
jgi:hypothetical protein